MKDSHVPLLRHRWPEWGRDNRKPLASALPFFQRESATYVHIVRSGEMHYYKGKLSHVSYSFWCGGSGFMGLTRKIPAVLVSEPATGRKVCATCIARSIGAGQMGESPHIDGKPVKFQPREKFMYEGNAA